MGVLHEIYFPLNHFGSRWHSLHFAFVALNIFLAGVVRYNIILFHHFPFLLFFEQFGLLNFIIQGGIFRKRVIFLGYRGVSPKHTEQHSLAKSMFTLSQSQSDTSSCEV